MIYVLYHSNCYDGFGAAYAAWKKFGDRAKYIPVSYGAPLPDMPGATECFIVDFSYPREVIEALAERMPLTILDHHKTAQEALEPLIKPDGFNPRVIFDMNRSGALITWEYFHGGFAVEVPRLIQHISDRDLWQFKLPGSKEVHSALVSLPFDFHVWDKLDVDQLIQDGAACLRFESSVVDKIVKGAWIGEVDNQLAAMVNTAAHWSEVGDALLEKYRDQPGVKFAASFTVFRDQTMWSLRSRGDFDVSAIAKKFGGGGHKNAAGFKTARVLMNTIEFDTLMNIVYSRWGAKSYPAPVKERIWYFVKDLPQKSFEAIIYTLLDASKYAPMPQEFKMLAYGEKDRLGLRKSKEAESKPSVEAKCWDCADTGNLFTVHREKGTTATFRCHCPAGSARSQAQGAQWSNNFAAAYEIQPVYTKGLGDWTPDEEKKLDEMVAHIRALVIRALIKGEDDGPGAA